MLLLLRWRGNACGNGDVLRPDRFWATPCTNPGTLHLQEWARSLNPASAKHGWAAAFLSAHDGESAVLMGVLRGVSREGP